MKHGTSWTHDHRGCRCGPCKDAKRLAAEKAAVTARETRAREVENSLPTLAIERPPWERDALCAQTDPDSFFPDKGGSTREAKAICVRCPVRLECLEFAVANGERYGIWGGLSERERRKLEGLAA